MHTKVALFDWDGTMADRFSIVRFVDALLEKKVIGDDVKQGLLEIFRKYRDNIITYDAMAKEAVDFYVNGLKGCLYTDILDTAENCFEEESKHVFPYANKIFSAVNNNGVISIVISGAPIEVLNLFKVKYGINKVFGLEVEVESGICTGKVKQNPAMLSKKREITDEIRSGECSNIVLACGDSSSDVPLLRAAKNVLVVNNREIAQELEKEGANVLMIDTKDDNELKIERFLVCLKEQMFV